MEKEQRLIDANVEGLIIMPAFSGGAPGLKRSGKHIAPTVKATAALSVEPAGWMMRWG